MLPQHPDPCNIIVGIPSYNEERTIMHVTRQVDYGLRSLAPPRTCLIVNVDSESNDGTHSAFQHTPTTCPKHWVQAGKNPRGKGVNLIKLFNLATDLNAKYVATIDADVTSVTPEWPQKLLEPLISRQRDYAIPLYTRDRFDATTTNQFAYPLIHGTLAADIRQPIGGDFAVSKKLYQHLLHQTASNTVLQFGIDMFITCHALAGGFAVEEVPMGRKIHKSGFSKMELAFAQVATAALQTLRPLLREEAPLSRSFKAAEKLPGGIDSSSNPRPHAAVEDLLQRMRTKFFTNQGRYSAHLGPWMQTVMEQLHQPKLAMTKEIWTAIIAHCVHRALYAPIDEAEIPTLVDALTPSFVMRVVAFWQQVKNLEPAQVERIVQTQAELFSNTLARHRSGISRLNLGKQEAIRKGR